MKKAIYVSELLIDTSQTEQLSRNAAGAIKLETAALKIGEFLVSGVILPRYSKDISATICWLSSDSFSREKHLMIQHVSGDYPIEQLEIHSVIDTKSMQELTQEEALGTNDIAKITLKLNLQMIYDPYVFNKVMGSFIVIHTSTNATAAAGMID